MVGALPENPRKLKEFFRSLWQLAPLIQRHDTDEVIKVLEDTAKTVEVDDAFRPSILAPLEVLGVESLGDTGVTIRIRMKTLPQRQWDVARELRRRIKKAFESNEIEIPYVPLVARK